MLRMRIYHNPASDVILSGAKNLWNNSQIAAERKYIRDVSLHST